MEMRIEQKYLCNEMDYQILKARLATLMEMDENTIETPDGTMGYHIRSVYFDDMYQSKFYENEHGVDDRNKYRIRAYNNSDAVLHFERKSKQNGYNHKEAFSLTPARYAEFVAEEFTFVPSEIPLENEISLQRLTSRLAPSLIVAYDREAYVNHAGNVRITFDRNIAASHEIADFFDPQLPMMPVLQTGQFILEVKFDAFLPRQLEQALDIKKMQQITFSKFYMGKLALAKQDGGYRNHPVQASLATV